MGLDQFAYATRKKLNSPVDFEINDSEDSQEIQYWRKHPNLHGWMERLYREKGGSGESFNCSPVELTQEDLDELVLAILDGKLPQTSGFFFGESSGDEEEKKEDLEFCKTALNYIKEGYRVYYNSWW